MQQRYPIGSWGIHPVFPKAILSKGPIIGSSEVTTCIGGEHFTSELSDVSSVETEKISGPMGGLSVEMSIASAHIQE